MAKAAGWLLGGLIVLALPLRGQALDDSRWLPWLGCWEALPGDSEEQLGARGVLVCIRPAPDGRGVEVATVEGGEVVGSEILVADGARRSFELEGCSGWQSVRFSEDARRVFLRSEQVCEGGLRKAGSGIMALASPDRWLDARSMEMEGERAAAVVRYRPAPESDWPEEFTLSSERRAAVRDARFVAAAELSLDDLAEAAAAVDREAVVEFLIELGQPFRLDGAAIASLADRGVPDEVIDVAVALSFPDRFAIDRQVISTRGEAEREQPRRYRARRYGGPFYWGVGRYCYASPWYWSPYCDPYLYWGYGFSYFGYGPYYGYGYRVPVVVIRPVEPDTRGRAVSGRGYTRSGGGSGGGGQAVARPRSGGQGSSPSVSRSGESGSSSSASPQGYRGSSGGAKARKRGG
ncbi:MAG: hypothetical protein KatS3mg081_2339 [Gemmatimonadales bacterium]|nr:MAG: hypothetical protein KatS3mg081_2339 [Gemmatimonadales bacterium]